MRCRYCNKAISLLRRMNDAEFCSDAHRHSYGEEQQLAMRRLTETQPPLQRTQRLQAVPHAPVAAPRTAHMAIMGEILSPGPDPVPPPFAPRPDPAPVTFLGVVHFVEREQRVVSGAPFSGRTVPVPMSPRNLAIRKAASPERSWSVQPVPPRRGDISPARNRAGLPAGSSLRPLSASPAGSRPRSVVSLFPAAGVELRALPGGHRRRNPLLPESRRLVAIPARAAGLCAPPLRRERLEPASPGQPGFALALPAARLAAIAPPSTEPAPEVWEVLEQSGLAALLAATGIAPVSPAARAARPLPVPAEPYDPFLPEPEARRVGAVRPAGVAHRLDTVVALRPVPAPALAGHAVLPKRKARPVAGLPVRHLPEHASPARRLALSLVTGSCPVAPPAPAFASRVAALAVRPLGPAEAPPVFESRRTPVRHMDFSVVSLRGVLLLDPPPPSGRTHAPLAPPVASAVPPAPGVPTLRLAAGLRRMAAGVSLVAPARPLAVDTRRRPHPLPAVPPDMPVRPPSTVSRLSVRSARAGCLPLAALAPVAIATRPQPVAYVDLVPAAGVPARTPRPVTLSLRRLSNRIFRVPGAQCTPRDWRIRPLALGLDLWASAPAICPAGLAWDDGKPRPKSRRAPRLSGNLLERFSPNGVFDAWSKVRRLPSDLKWIAMVVPLIIGIWVFARPSDDPAPRQVAESRAVPPAEPVADPVVRPSDEEQAAISPVAAPVPIAKAEPAPPPVETPKEDRDAPSRPLPASNPSAWDTFTARVASRASVDLVEDFQKGLSLWDGRGEWARTWSYDRAGTVRPGHMAFFQPTVGLRDYVMEMKASIDRRAIQWLVRASSPQNYHFARLNVTPGAPLTKLEFERWSVVNGKTGRVTRLPLPHAGANQTLFDIRVEVRGDTVTTYLQEQVIDTFSDPRLPEGGIGLVGSGDDRPRIYGLRVYHQNDFLGKLCSFFASPPIANQGSE